RVLGGALCYVALRNPEEAVSFMREGVSRGVESPMIYAELGQTAVSIGDTLVAEWAFQKLVSMGRENSECLYFLAASDLNRGVVDRAIQRLEKAVELNPRNGRALSLLGSIRYNLGQLELARDLLVRAVRCRDAGPEAELWLGRVCRAPVQRHRSRIMNLVCRFINDRDRAEEISQEVFLRVYRNRERYRKSGKFSTWIFTIAVNLTKNEIRSRVRHKGTFSLDAMEE